MKAVVYDIPVSVTVAASGGALDALRGDRTVHKIIIECCQP